MTTEGDYRGSCVVRLCFSPSEDGRGFGALTTENCDVPCVRGYSTTVSASALQAEDVGSIPITRSQIERIQISDGGD